MKFSSYVIVLFSFFTSFSLFAQDDITIKEGQQVQLCGKYVNFDLIWFDHGITKADISILEKQNSKAITAGYNVGDEIKIKNGCSYFVNAIFKQSHEIILSVNSPPLVKEELPQKFSLSLNDKVYLSDSQGTIKRIFIDDAGNPSVEISIQNKTKPVFLKEGSIVWEGGNPFILKSIKVETLSLNFEIDKNNK